MDDQGNDAFTVKLLATIWPITIPIASVVYLFQSLYKVAVKDAGVSRAQKRDRQIKWLEADTEIVKPVSQAVDTRPNSRYSDVSQFHDDTWGD